MDFKYLMIATVRRNRKVKMRNRIVTIYNRYPRIAKIIRLIHNSTGGNKIKTGESTFRISDTLMKKTRIVFNGKNNKLIIDKDVRLFNCNFFILGENNTIIIGEKSILNNCDFWMEDNDNYIKLGASTTINGTTQIACIEGCRVIIGNDCMLSSEISIRTGDSHSIIDNEGARINSSKDVMIGNHVWIGTRCIINKGTIIRDNSIVGAGAVVTKVFNESNIIIAGNPARIIRNDIGWRRERI